MTPQPNQPIEVTAQHLKCAEEVIQWHHAHNEFLTANIVAEIIAKHFIEKLEQQQEKEVTKTGIATNNTNVAGATAVVSGGATAENNAQPSPETATPRTDAWLVRIGAPYGWDDFARTIERELSAANAKIEELEIRHAATMMHGQNIVDELKVANAKIAELEKDGERLEHLFNESYFPPILEPFVVPPTKVVLTIGASVPINPDGYRKAIDDDISSQQQKDTTCP